MFSRLCGIYLWLLCQWLFGSKRVFDRAPYARFYRFHTAKFHKIWTQHVDRCRDESFWNIILKTFPWLIVFLQKKTQKNPHFSTSCDFTPPKLRNDYRSTEIHDPSTRCLVSFLPLESIQSHSPGQYAPHNKPPQMLCDVVSDCLSGRSLMTPSVSRRQPVTIDYWVTYTYARAHTRTHNHLSRLFYLWNKRSQNFKFSISN